MNELSAWLDDAGTSVLRCVRLLFIGMNAAAVALIFVKRDRGIVNRWTARWVSGKLFCSAPGLAYRLPPRLFGSQSMRSQCHAP